MSTKPSTTTNPEEKITFLSILEDMESSIPTPSRKRLEKSPSPSESDLNTDPERIPVKQFVVEPLKASDLPGFREEDW